jgi:hypothetical protein
MTKNSVAEYDTTPANNTDVGSIAITGASIPSNFDNALRQLMSHLRTDHDAVYALLGENLVINGGFDVNQREVSGTVTLVAGEYGHDQWRGGSSGCTYTFATSNNVTTITITAGSLVNVIEGKNLDSGTYCLSWTGTAQGKIDSGSYSATGVTGTAVGGTNLSIEFNTGTLSNVSLIEGSIAGNYKRRGTTVETLLCQRFCFKIFPDDDSGGTYYTPIGDGRWVSADRAFITIPLPVSMYSSPTLVVEGSGTTLFINTQGGVGGVAISAADVVIVRWHRNRVVLDITKTGTGSSAGQGATLFTNNQNTDGILITSELP